MASSSWFCLGLASNILEQMTDLTAAQHWAVAMAETVCAAGCVCILCTEPSGADAEADHMRATPRHRPRKHVRRSLPSTSSIMEVLYPSSYLGTPPAFPDPPSYYGLGGDTHPPPTPENSRERGERIPLISSATGTAGRTPTQSGPHDPLVDAPSLTGVPSPGAPSGRVLPAEPHSPVQVVGLGIDVLEQAEPPPAYSRFDENRSHLPVTSDLLGPYPHISMFNPPAQ